MTPRRSDKRKDVDNEDARCGFLFVSPNQPLPPIAVIVSAVLLVSIIAAGLIVLEMLLPGGLMVWAGWLVLAIIRWPALFAVPLILLLLFFNWWRGQP